MNFRRILSLILIVLLFPAVLSVSAKDTLPQNVLTELTVYKILQGDENGDLQLGEPVTRAEFAVMLSRTLRINDFPVSGGSVFSDVKESDWFYGDVVLLASYGVFHGDSDSLFHPFDDITVNETIKAIVSALGYSAAANSRGGYPAGFLVTAAELGILKNVSTESAFTRADLAQMLYNSLNVPLMDARIVSSLGGKILYTAGETCLRDYHLYSGSQGVRIKQRGIVEANTESWLIRPYGNLKAHQVVIDGYIYNVGQTDAYNYFGLEVEYYAVADNEDGPFTLESITPTAKNEVITMTEREFAGFSNETVSGEINGVRKTFRLINGNILIKNFRRIQVPLERDYSITRGTVTLIDNDGDGQFDIAIIEEFETMLVECANKDGIWFRSSSFRGQRAIQISDDVQYYITDVSGKPLFPEEIPPLSVLSITANSAETIYKIRVSSEKITGTVEETAKDYITVNGETVLVESGAELEVFPGDKIDCCLNFRREAFYTDATDFTHEYAYVIAAGRTSRLGTVQLKLALPGRFAVDKKTDLEDENAVAVKTLKARNSEIKTFSLSHRVTVTLNGITVRLPAEEAMGRIDSLQRPIIRFIANSNGEITEISEPKIIGNNILDTDFLRKYNGNELVFGGNAVRGAFGVMDNTRALCVPGKTADFNDDVTNENDYLAGIEMLNEGSYTVNGYDITAENENAHLIVIQFTQRYDSNIDPDENKIAILECASKTIDDEGDIIARLTFWSQGEQFSYNAEPEIADQLINGDVFLYTLGANSDRIVQTERIARLSNEPEGYTAFPGAGTRYKTFGDPINVEYNRILEAEYRRADIITVHDINTKFNVNLRNGPAVYTYDKQSRKIQPAKTADIIPGGTNKVFVYNAALKIRIIVIVR